MAASPPLNLPLGQIEHTLALALLYFPPVQAVHESVAPLEYFPGEHSEHSPAPDELKVPAAQSLQVVAPAIEYLPPVQASQLPPLTETVPATHLVQEVSSLPLLFPAAQSRQEV